MSRSAPAEQENDVSFLEKLSAIIVDKRNLIFLVVIILLIFSVFSRNWVEVESDLTAYLPDDSQTKQALNIMEDQFITYGTADIMVANVTLDEAARDLMDLVLEVASGKKTRAEEKGYREISIFKDGVVL